MLELTSSTKAPLPLDIVLPQCRTFWVHFKLKGSLLVNVFKKVKNIYTLYRPEFIYLVVGGLTTLINFAIYFMAKEIAHIHYIASNILAWVVAVLFAYAANRTWVFYSKGTDILLEIWLFIMSRIFSLTLETMLLFAAVDILHISDFIAKITIAVLVVICNYMTGKWIVFKRRK